jgi:hypothetical protein
LKLRSISGLTQKVAAVPRRVSATSAIQKMREILRERAFSSFSVFTAMKFAP